MDPTENEKQKRKVLYSELFIKEENPLMAEESAISYVAKRYSYADYLTWTDGVMREIIDGVVYAFSAPTLKHARAISKFFGESFIFLSKRKGKGKEKRKCEIFTAPFDVRFYKDGVIADDNSFNIVQPDICVVCDPTILDDAGCIGAPDMIAEVLSPSTSKRDLGVKFSLYEEFGVKEYWVVHPIDRNVTVFLLQPNGKYNEGITYDIARGNTKVPVKTLEGLVIDLNDLFDN
jgi:Uma2 family endonuclease